jgi:hypothetical protein
VQERDKPLRNTDHNSDSMAPRDVDLYSRDIAQQILRNAHVSYAHRRIPVNLSRIFGLPIET